MILPHIQNIEFLKENVDSYEKEEVVENLLQISRSMKFKAFKAGEDVFKYGDKGNEFFIILKGKVSVRAPRQEKVQKGITDKIGTHLKQFMVQKESTSARASNIDTSS